MADPEIPEVRAELQREDVLHDPRIEIRYEDRRLHSLLSFVIALAALVAIAYLLLR